MIESMNEKMDGFTKREPIKMTLARSTSIIRGLVGPTSHSTVAMEDLSFFKRWYIMFHKQKGLDKQTIFFQKYSSKLQYSSTRVVVSSSV
mmetsp:Transcript_1095/g.1568  ORF Transcript_1095/g.1568 Transcript_1095/m.1568 type:complete len:90 (-) Transcript_1095:70-339(-)